MDFTEIEKEVLLQVQKLLSEYSDKLDSCGVFTTSPTIKAGKGKDGCHFSEIALDFFKKMKPDDAVFIDLFEEVIICNGIQFMKVAEIVKLLRERILALIAKNSKTFENFTSKLVVEAVSKGTYEFWKHHKIHGDFEFQDMIEDSESGKTLFPFINLSIIKMLKFSDIVRFGGGKLNDESCDYDLICELPDQISLLSFSGIMMFERIRENILERLKCNFKFKKKENKKIRFFSAGVLFVNQGEIYKEKLLIKKSIAELFGENSVEIIYNDFSENVEMYGNQKLVAVVTES